jgi:hypothetical protein
VATANVGSVSFAASRHSDRAGVPCVSPTLMRRRDRAAGLPVTQYDLAVRRGANATVRELEVRQWRLGHVFDVKGGVSSES